MASNMLYASQLPTRSPNYLFGLGGSSHIQHYPNDLFSDNFKLQLRLVEYTMTDYVGQRTTDKFLDFRPKLDFVVLFLGGNDLDRRNFTNDQHLFVLHNFFQAARTLFNNGIRPYIVAIQERRCPKNVSYQAYEDRRRKLNSQLGTTLSRMLEYNPVLATPDYDNKFTTDGIHLSTEDYYHLTQHIERIVAYDTRHPVTYGLTPLQKNPTWVARNKRDKRDSRKDYCRTTNTRQQTLHPSPLTRYPLPTIPKRQRTDANNNLATAPMDIEFHDSTPTLTPEDMTPRKRRPTKDA